MAGFPRRPKPLKARVSLDDLNFVEIANLAEGDLLVYDATDGVFQNTQTLSGSYTFTNDFSATGATFTGSVAVGNDLTVADDLTVLGDTSLQALLATNATLSGTLSVAGNATFSGTVSVSGTLSFASFSVSGNGSIAGNLTIGGTLAVTGAVSLASTLSAGATTLSSLTVTGNVLVGGNQNVIGNLTAGAVAGGTVSSAGTIFGGTTLDLAGAIYTSNGITFLDDGTAVQLLNGTTTILSLDAASITEGAGVPTTAAGRGSLWLRNDGPDDGTLYYYGASGWRAVKDTSSDLDFLMQDWATRQEYILTGSLEAGDITTSKLNLTGTTVLSPGHHWRLGDREVARFNRIGGRNSAQLTLTGNLAYADPPAYVAASLPAALMVLQSDFTFLTLDTYSSAGTTQNTHLSCRRSRSNFIGGFDTLSAGDRIGAYTFQGTDGSAFQNVGQMSVYVDGAVSAGIVPGYISFNTTNSSGGFPERFRIDSTGLIRAAAGAKFAVVDSFGTGAETPVFACANKPGAAGTAPSQWLTINLNGTDYYIPCFL